jgi:hypothetical protein
MDIQAEDAALNHSRTSDMLSRSLDKLITLTALIKGAGNVAEAAVSPATTALYSRQLFGSDTERTGDTHFRWKPSGAICLLTMCRSLMGPMTVAAKAKAES